MKPTTRVFLACALAGLLVGVLARVGIAYASRNSSGSYSLPTGNPVVTGTTISSTVHNATMADIKTEITDSLCRSGKGAMLAPLQGYVGSVSAPGYSFANDTNTGLYWVSADKPALACGGAKIQDWSAAGSTLVVALAVVSDGGLPDGGDVAAITATAAGGGNGSGVIATGTGTGAGLVGTGGASNGIGVSGTGAGGSAGGYLVGGLTGPGVQCVGGATSGAGGVFTATAGNSDGVTATASGTGSGVRGTGSTGAPSYGVKGTAGVSVNGAGVAGFAAQANNIAGVIGQGNVSGASGVYGQMLSGTGTTQAAGYFDSSGSGGYALIAIGDQSGSTGPRAPIHIQPTTGGAPTTCQVGDFYVTASGILKSCTTAGSPGTWHTVGDQAGSTP